MNTISPKGTAADPRDFVFSGAFQRLLWLGFLAFCVEVYISGRNNRALEDAPQFAAGQVVLRVRSRAGGYRLEAFVPAEALNGFDPEQHPRLGFFYAIRDEELGEQLLNITPEFPFWEDPSLWSVLELVR